MKDPDATSKGQGRLAWDQVWTVYRYELRSALREKAIVINSILIPIFLYPLIMWAAFSGIMLVQGQSEKTESRVAIQGWPEGHPGLRVKMERDRRLQIVTGTNRFDPSEIQGARLDAILEFQLPVNSASNLPGNFQAQITFDASKDRSVTARQRLETAIDEYRKAWLRREARKRGISAAEWRGISITPNNVASDKQMGGFILGMMLPILFVVMVAAGSFYPAVDCTAGERERNTWETLMSSGASRVSIVTAKYLYVTTMGGLAGALNLVAFALTLKPIFAPLLADVGAKLNFTVPINSIPILVLSALLLAGFVAAGMMIFAAFARTFKEGQAMIMPFYLIVLLPPMFLQTPGIKFSTPLAFAPVVNVTMMVRSAVAFSFPWLQIGITCIMSLLVIAGCIRIAAYILKFEDVLLGGYNGGLKQFVKEHFLRSKAAVASQMKGGND